ncbi:MAG: thiolase family protein, partial [Acidimicrobiia bacterium]
DRTAPPVPSNRRAIGFGAEGPMQWLSPYGVASAANWYALHLRRYMHEFGLTRTQLGALAVSARTKAALNPKAIYRDALTMEHYLSSRMISDPLCLYDCDVPCDGSTAFVVSAQHAVPDAPHGGVDIVAFGSAAGPRTFRDQLPDPWFGARAAAQMWAQTDLRPSDVDVAQLYDGFSFLALCWLESLGFCGRGEGGDFIDGGARIALDGVLPLNTSGGQLAAGRLHGLGLLHEACLQLRNQAGDRQVAGAEVAVVANGAVPNMGCMLLTRSR